MTALIDRGTPVRDAPATLSFDADVVLLDIEGTISPISFVRDVLFAYSRQHLSSFVAEHHADPVVADILAQASALAGGGPPLDALERWQNRDEKAPPLKKLQGLVWDAGYRSGALRSPLYPDALAALYRWHAIGLPLYIYSSGSVQAQLLFFEFNEAGDLRNLFTRHFDTDIGAKVETRSYARIADHIDTAPARIVFFSDSAKELEAARTAGLQVAHVVKDATPSDPDLPEVTDFARVEILRLTSAPAE